MTIRVALEHRTTYRFDRRVALSPHVVRLRPAPHSRTPVVSYSLKVEPAEHFLNWQQDPFGNYLARLVFPSRTRCLDITVDLVAELTPVNPFDFFLEDGFEQVPFTYPPETAHELAPYLVTQGSGPLLDEWLASVDRSPTPTNDFLVALNQRLQRDIGYSTRMEPGVQSPEETLGRRIGSCRDSAWLLVQILRRLGLAARFVSGYLVQLVADVAPLDGPAGPAADFTDLHAWTEVYLPGAGWVGLDPTSGLFAGEGHIPLAATPDPVGAAPVTGAMDECEVEFSHSNTVRRILETPRVTLPYSDAQWAAIDALGHAVDRDLARDDVRLTQGGEPTFVSVSDMESPEWTIAPDGPTKRVLASRLTAKLVDRFAPGGLVHFGQGKWYPGEELPRWQMEILWRADGHPLWRDPALLAAPWADPAERSGQSLAQAHPSGRGAAAVAADRGADASGGDAHAERGNNRPDVRDSPAERLARAIAERLGIAADHCVPAYEDPLDRLAAEAMLPDGPPPERDVDPTDPARADPDHRRALLAALDADRGEPIGWTLFVHALPGAAGERTRWGTTRWSLRRGHLMLRPGDSPMGLRLPLGSLSWFSPPPQPEPSSFEPRGPLPAPQGVAGVNGSAPLEPSQQAPGRPAPPSSGGEGLSAPSTSAPYSALCVQPRDGRLHVFLPPMTHLEHAVDLLAAIEEAADATGTRVVLEGYPLPPDPRLGRLVVGADPGVIEVNMHPASGWAELVEITEGLYADAHQVGLGTEKFDVDGLHTGTGGGNHVTLGGPTPADSPLLRRPDLLGSLLTFWQHHPALSYLFSGRFIGPTSQSPRVDEGRAETLYELEIAFAELSAALARARAEDAEPPAWLPDRLLRHLLTDITGNTHRAEFCIDKLYAPGGERGRLGLLELRAFEMPPHARMALVQALLVRALVARFWRTPYTGRLVRWGTELHDRFLLPAYVAADIAEVTADLREHGYPFADDWLDPFLEFRFPLIGQVEIGRVELELRTAIEPWPVLGEEVAANGPARYVDSSVERLQVQVSGATAGRHVVTCNGVPVPLRPSGVAGRQVAGVRYKAWQPHSALHPTIGVHAPLVFDLVDTWNGRSVGGCTYHVSHPGGRGYEDFPVNAAAAATRRASRFTPFGHTPGPVRVSAPVREVGAEYAHTLDLRRPH